MMKIPEWVLNGEGTATIMWDGVRVMRDDAPGSPWLLHDGDAWLAARQTKYASALDNALAEWRLMVGGIPPAGVYQLVGPSLSSNPHAFDRDRLLALDSTRWKWDRVPRTEAEIKAGLEVSSGYQAVVFTHPDGSQWIVRLSDFEEG